MKGSILQVAHICWIEMLKHVKVPFSKRISDAIFKVFFLISLPLFSILYHPPSFMTR